MKIMQIRGVNEKRAKDFAKLNITDTESLVKYFPRAYLDMTNRVSVREVLHNDTALICARLTAVEPMRYTGRVRYLKAWLEQDGDVFSAIWFNMPYLAKQLTEGTYLFYGRVQNRYGQVSIVNPSFEKIDKRESTRLKGLVPVYSLKGGLTQRVMRASVAEALKTETFLSVIPEMLINKYKISSLKAAYYHIHAPETQQTMQKAAERIALEEYFTLVSAFKLIKGDKNEARINRYKVTPQDILVFEKRFPFSFTEGQQKAVRAIYDNVTSPVRMNRLLQGDVGSGKTAVALTGIFMAVKSGYQAVYLSPTEVLAAQNYKLLEKVFPERRIGYLAGGCSVKEKREIKAEIGRAHV